MDAIKHGHGHGNGLLRAFSFCFWKTDESQQHPPDPSAPSLRGRGWGPARSPLALVLPGLCTSSSAEASRGRDEGGRAEWVGRGFPRAPSSLVRVLHCCPDKGSPVPPHNYSLSASLSISAADFLPTGSLSRGSLGTECGWKAD